MSEGVRREGVAIEKPKYERCYSLVSFVCLFYVETTLLGYSLTKLFLLTIVVVIIIIRYNINNA